MQSTVRFSFQNCMCYTYIIIEIRTNIRAIFISKASFHSLYGPSFFLSFVEWHYVKAMFLYVKVGLFRALLVLYFASDTRKKGQQKCIHYIRTLHTLCVIKAIFITKFFNRKLELTFRLNVAYEFYCDNTGFMKWLNIVYTTLLKSALACQPHEMCLYVRFIRTNTNEWIDKRNIFKRTTFQYGME